MRRIEYFLTGRDPKSMTVSDLMQDAVVTCAPHTDAHTVAQLLTLRHIGSLPVIREDRTLVGLVAEYDLLQSMIQGRDLKRITAADIMTERVLTVGEETTMEHLAALFQDRYVTRVPVVRGDKLVGIVARRDLVFGYLKAVQYWS